MSTHAAIIKKNEATGDWRGIYVHSDGYPDHAGRILKEHYSTDEQIEDLIELGDLSSLGETLEETTAYHRDRGEKRTLRASKALWWIASKIDWEHLYLWTEEGWEHFTRRDDPTTEWMEAEVAQAERQAGWDQNP